MGRVSTEVLFSLPAEYGIKEFRGIFIVDFSRNSAEFRGIPYVYYNPSTACQEIQ